MDFWTFAVIGGFGYLLVKRFYVFKNEQGKIKDESVYSSTIINELSDFRPVVFNDDPTEAQLQKLLYDFLKARFVHVKRELMIEGMNGLKIDLDVGRGKVGIEVKKAKSLFKTVILQRLIGQMRDYIGCKYGRDCLIVVAFGSSVEADETTYLSDINDRVVAAEGHFVFVEYSIIK